MDKIFTTDDLAGDVEALFLGRTYYDDDGNLCSEEEEIRGALAYLEPVEKDENGSVTLYKVTIPEGREKEVNEILSKKEGVVGL